VTLAFASSSLVLRRLSSSSHAASLSRALLTTKAFVVSRPSLAVASRQLHGSFTASHSPRGNFVVSQPFRAVSFVVSHPPRVKVPSSLLPPHAANSSSYILTPHLHLTAPFFRGTSSCHILLARSPLRRCLRLTPPVCPCCRTEVGGRINACVAPQGERREKKERGGCVCRRYLIRPCRRQTRVDTPAGAATAAGYDPQAMISLAFDAYRRSPSTRYIPPRHPLRGYRVKRSLFDRDPHLHTHTHTPHTFLYTHAYNRLTNISAWTQTSRRSNAWSKRRCRRRDRQGHGF
jgi:hypothetical protein